MLQIDGGWVESIHKEDRTGVRDTIARILNGEHALTHRYRIVRPDGSVRWIRNTCFPIRGDGQRLRCVAGIAEDITRDTEALVYLLSPDNASRERLLLLLRKSGYQVQEFATTKAFLDLAPVLSAGCVLLDLKALEAAESISLLQQIKARRIILPVVVVDGGREDAGLAVRVMKAGAVDYLAASDDGPGPLLAAVASALAEIRDAANRDNAVELARRHIAAMPAREREVLHGLLAGATNKEMARVLGISPRTVEIHRAHAMERIGARNLPEAVLLAMAAGLKPSWPPGDGG
jgi:FixJ family two-component response regulator